MTNSTRAPSAFPTDALSSSNGDGKTITSDFGLLGAAIGLAAMCAMCLCVCLCSWLCQMRRHALGVYDDEEPVPVEPKLADPQGQDGIVYLTDADVSLAPVSSLSSLASLHPPLPPSARQAWVSSHGGSSSSRGFSRLAVCPDEGGAAGAGVGVGVGVGGWMGDGDGEGEGEGEGVLMAVRL